MRYLYGSRSRPIFDMDPDTGNLYGSCRSGSATLTSMIIAEVNRIMAHGVEIGTMFVT